MRITQLTYFESVCRLGSVTKASEEMLVSQPSVSMAIKELEMEFGVNLFVRTNNRLHLTEEGRFFYQEVKKILNQLDHLSDEMKKLGLDNHDIRIAVPPIIGVFLFPVIFSGFRAKYADLNMIIQDYNLVDACRALENGLVDFAIIISDTVGYKNYQAMNLLETSLHLCVSKNSPLADREQISLSQLAQEPLILMRDGSFQYRKIISYFRAEGISPHIVLFSNQLYTIFNNVAEGAASAFLIRQMADLHPACKGIPIREPLDLHIQLLWKDSPTLNKRFALLIDHLRNIDISKYFSKIQI